MPIEINGTSYETDEEGYLVNLADWNEELANIIAKTENHFGQFVFPKSVLSEQGILTTDLKEGKRAFRIYPPWEKPQSKQALKTQKWQSGYFLEIPNDQSLNLRQAERLYSLQNGN